uniref:Uncharacterized protein n=1 Tax=Meloidogyne enterolobii TaxID=390850 RepID=A0A6V7VFF8_MELEN|nr:unnamed protein product [Meloidogyne enterolobii]
MIFEAQLLICPLMDSECVWPINKAEFTPVGGDNSQFKFKINQKIRK